MSRGIVQRTNVKYGTYTVQEGMEENILFNNALNTFYFTVIWRWTYGSGPLR